ncbi:hypothetical protein [Chitinophaga nivalis]|uniref:Uncharacterized protein n=1 Tax=Chitinophaga nivalis TaxID=2991709 RepID=A0ABT3IRK2_9BACT|nr:hypothetical protein [Chitinophaga nivalis]MCW3463925.1 hypothetical protein [Chitinophaga nivalis]MCW3486385.1 hypothetical protein [Chitinophaga nivalis]
MKNLVKAAISPRVIIMPLAMPQGVVQVVRDDMLIGGTKQRALYHYLTTTAAAGYNEIVYASPPPASEQVALAYMCQQRKVACTLFCWQMDKRYHPFSLQAESFGATIYPCDSLEQAEIAARVYTEHTPDSIKLPLGFNVPAYIDCLKAEIATSWQHVIADLGYEPARVWLPAGSAVLSNVFREVVSEDTLLNCVNVRLLPEEEERIRAVASRAGVHLFRARESFLEPCIDIPPIPSNPHYDAKLWYFIHQYGQHQDVWWNAAR